MIKLLQCSFARKYFNLRHKTQRHEVQYCGSQSFSPFNLLCIKKSHIISKLYFFINPSKRCASVHLVKCGLLFIQIKWVVLFVLLYVSPHGFSLLVQTGCHLLVHISKKQFRIGFQAFLGPFEGFHHRLAGLLAPAPLIILAPPTACCHVVPQPGDGMVLLVPVVHLVHRAVGRAVVAGAVVANPEESIDKFNHLPFYNFIISKLETFPTVLKITRLFPVSSSDTMCFLKSKAKFQSNIILLIQRQMPCAQHYQPFVLV